MLSAVVGGVSVSDVINFRLASVIMTSFLNVCVRAVGCAEVVVDSSSVLPQQLLCCRRLLWLCGRHQTVLSGIITWSVLLFCFDLRLNQSGSRHVVSLARQTGRFHSVYAGLHQNVEAC